MPRVDVVVSCHVKPSFRVAQACGVFDFPASGHSEERFGVEVPGLDEPWTIGAIVGPSGMGKSSVARAAFGAGGAVCPDALKEGFAWPADQSVLDGFDPALDGGTLAKILASVGFSTPPAWVRPHRVLSNGQRFRCDLARAMVEPGEVVAIDEYTSLVDRQVAKFASASLARTIRDPQRTTGPKRFVAVTCHYDVLEWLEVDWVLDMATGTLARGRLRRPRIELEVRHARRTLWEAFRKHHYLDHALAPFATRYAALAEGRPVAFLATIPAMGHTGMRRVHRLVVLPDFQGLGIGTKLLNLVADHETALGYKFAIATSQPALVAALSGRREWKAVFNKKPTRHKGKIVEGREMGTGWRITASFQYRGKP